MSGLPLGNKMMQIFVKDKMWLLLVVLISLLMAGKVNADSIGTKEGILIWFYSLQVKDNKSYGWTKPLRGRKIKLQSLQV